MRLCLLKACMSGFLCGTASQYFKNSYILVIQNKNTNYDVIQNCKLNYALVLLIRSQSADNMLFFVRFILKPF